MKKILFRADAKPSIGIGDLNSLINLSFYFQDDWSCYFIIRSYKAGVDLTKKHNLKNIFIIDENLSLEEEVEYINSFIQENHIDIIFIQIFEHSLKNYSNLKKDIPKACVNHYEYNNGEVLNNFDLVVDWDTLAKDNYEIDSYKNTQFLLGIKYVILPKEFYSQRVQNRKYNTNPKKLLIAMGGADEFNFTQKLVESIIKNRVEIELNIIIGSGYEYKDTLTKTLQNSTLTYTIRHNITNMLDEYLSSDIAIASGGLTASELVASKTPTILIATYEHQITRCKYFDENSLAKYLGYKEFDEEELVKLIKKPILPSTSILFDTKEIVNIVNSIVKKDCI